MLRRPLLSLLSLLSLCLLALPAVAQQPSPAEALEPPPLPPPLRSGEQIAPDVTIRQDERGTVEEYRINGRLYLMRVTPTSGPAYYLVDQDGDGVLETRHDRLGPGITPPQWLLHSW